MNRPASKPRGKHLGLPIKITGIVFWGMLLVGLAVTTGFVFYLEHRLQAERELKYDLAMSSVHRLIEIGSSDDYSSLAANLEQLRVQLEFSAMEVAFDDHRYSVGSKAEDLQAQYIPFSYETSGSNRTGEILVFQEPLDSMVNELRKNILVAMALLFLGFGLVLQTILKRVISQPITNMVKTAEELVNGKKNLKFDDSRDDEFGFLGRFINKALSHLTRKQRELESSLEKQKIIEQILSSEKERAEVTLNSITDAVLTTSRSGRVDYVNRAAEEMTGKTRSELAGEDVSVALNLRDRDSNSLLKLPVNAAVDRELSQEVVRLRGNCILLRETGKQRDIEYTVAPILDPSRRISGSVIVLQDVTEARRLNSKLTYQALHDGLTGLYNRSEFDRRLRSLLSRTYEEDDLLHGLLYMDLDQFKVVNDSCGHMAGDELLRQISERLQQRIRKGDTLARLGGDEFGVLINVSTPEQINSIANELREEVEDFRFVWDNKTFTLGVSIGMVMIDRNSENPDILLSMADRACYAAKESGRNKVRLYQPNDIEMLRRNRDTQWVSKLRDAIRNGGLQLTMQRIVPVSSETQSGEIFEILVGMLNARGQRISASSFLPAAERYTLMPELDRWIVSHVFSWLARNPLQMERLEHCMINLSGQTLNDDNFPGFVLAQMERKKIPPKKICFEITETAAIANLARTAELIKALKTEGCSFALDDFGSGMSSYTYLKYLPIDYIKIDGVFVRDIVKDRIDRAMVQSINDIGHIMGKRTIAEYVENPEILSLLKEIGVDYAQGFGIARPVPIADDETPPGDGRLADK